MASWGLLELDTTPPEIAWGEILARVDGAFSAEYLSNEPLGSADLVLLDGRVVALDVEAEQIVGSLPGNSAGLATLVARDVVGNETTRDVGVTGPAWVTLELDTVAPVITWGAYTGATAGELLRVAYTIDGPSLLSASILLADGRTLVMSTGSPLEVLLPPDTPNGPATVSAFVRDALGNSATRTHVVDLTGVAVVVKPVEPRPSWPGTPRRARPTRRVQVTSRGIVHLRSVAATGALVRAVSSVATTSTNAVFAQATSRSPVRLVSRTGLQSRVTTRSEVAGSSAGTVARRDGADMEALILLL